MKTKLRKMDDLPRMYGWEKGKRREKKKGTRGGEEGKLSAPKVQSTGTANPMQINMHMQVPLPNQSTSVVG